MMDGVVEGFGRVENVKVGTGVGVDIGGAVVVVTGPEPRLA